METNKIEKLKAEVQQAATEHLNAGAAIFTAKFRWRSTDTKGEMLNLQGVWSAMFVREKDCWKINMRHESFSP